MTVSKSLKGAPELLRLHWQVVLDVQVCLLDLLLDHGCLALGLVLTVVRHGCELM